MTSYMLDTNIASHVIRGDRPEISQKLAALPMEEIVISSVTEGGCCMAWRNETIRRR